MKLINPSIDFANCASRLWDAVVIGAGPAGSMAALKLARSGVSVLLVDKAEHPRFKVCGCCLNDAAVAVLEEEGLKESLLALNAVSIDRLSLYAGGHHADVQLSHGLVLSRAALDSLLLRTSIAEGSEYLSLTTAFVGELDSANRLVYLQRDGEVVTARARSVVVADGLGGRSLERVHLLPATVEDNSRIGGGAIAKELPLELFHKGVIYMTCGKGGYVGMVKLEDGTLDIAAAFDKEFVQSFKSLGGAANFLVSQTSLSALDLSSLQWQGTPPLTRRREAVSAPAIFVIGDAASYAEPFSGEGMAWSLASGAAIAPIIQRFLSKDVVDFRYSEWDDLHRKLVADRQCMSMFLAHFLRYPKLVELSTAVLNTAPFLASPIVKKINTVSIAGSANPKPVVRG